MKSKFKVKWAVYLLFLICILASLSVPAFAAGNNETDINMIEGIDAGKNAEVID